MGEQRVSLRLVDEDREARLPLLLEADESEPVVRTYMHDGNLYDLVVESGPGSEEGIGVVLLLAPLPGEVEIKNIALSMSCRGRGLGRASIAAIAAHVRAGGARRLVVGTADAAPDTIAFYLACGFRRSGRSEGFFDAYPEPIFIDGVQVHDMVLFDMDL
ncbi:MAG: GNAT family N-acetyltransferase [Actinomycetota bacterium]